jgi:hypothetical protein
MPPQTVPCGECGDDDYDVLCDGVVVGRIMKAAVAPMGMSWMRECPGATNRSVSSKARENPAQAWGFGSV